MNAVRACVDDARELAISCSQAGWLARMAYACAMDAEFPRLASKAVSTLRAAGLGARLCAPAFMESGKAMRNLLKELGNGSVDAGIVRLRADTTAQALVAKAADVPVAAVEKDAKQHPTLVGATQLVTDASARQAECDRVFHDYVTSSYNSITSDGFERLCIDLGILDGINPEDQAAAARTALVAADGDYDGALSFDEFQSFYLRHPVTSIRLHLRVTAGLAMERRVRHTFAVFAAFGSPKKGASPENSPTLDCSRFAKLCRDSGLLGGGMTAQHVDVVYTSAKPREARRMTFDHFICALTMVANRRGQPLETVLELVAAVRRPALHGTQAGFVKLHDDKDMITGVCARGGPSLGAVNLDLRMIVDRSKEPKSPPPPSGAVPKRVDPTRPESPKLATKDRIVSSGPVTPGRGASLAAKEQRDAAKLLAMASPRGAHSVFGRTSTPRAAQLATPRGGRKSGAAMRLDTTRVGELLIPVSQSQASTQWVSMSDSVAMLGRNEEDAVEVSGSGADMDALFEEALAQEADGGDGELRVADILLANEEGLTGDECFAGAGEDTHETEGSVVQDEVAEARGLQPQAETPKGEETVLSDILDKCMVLGEEHVTEEGG